MSAAGITFAITAGIGLFGPVLGLRMRFNQRFRSLPWDKADTFFLSILVAFPVGFAIAAGVLA